MASRTFALPGGAHSLSGKPDQDQAFGAVDECEGGANLAAQRAHWAPDPILRGSQGGLSGQSESRLRAVLVLWGNGVRFVTSLPPRSILKALILQKYNIHTEKYAHFNLTALFTK